MLISVKGKNEKIDKKELKFIIEFFGNILLGKRLSKYVLVELKHEPMKKTMCGFCTPTDYGYRNHREFEITLNSKLSKAMMIRTLAHEMVHVMQFARNEFKILNDRNLYKWRGKIVEMSHKNYYDMPWEIEAHISENHLIKSYINHLKRNRHAG